MGAELDKSVVKWAEKNRPEILIPESVKALISSTLKELAIGEKVYNSVWFSVGPNEKLIAEIYDEDGNSSDKYEVEVKVVRRVE